MGVLQTSKNQALLMSNSTNAQAKGKLKEKEPKASDSKPKESQNYSERGFSAKIKKKFEKTKRPYCMRGFHPKSHYMNK